VALASGCGGDPAAPLPIAVTVIPATVSLLAGGRQDFTATVANDPANTGVTWSITGCAGDPAACGSLINVTNTVATYTAPATVRPAALGVTATSVTDGTKSSTATVAITAPLPIVVTVFPATVSLLAGRSQDFTATVANDPTSTGVTWSITGCAGDPATCGSLTNVTNTMATYTAPATVSPAALGVTATSVADGTKSSTAAVAITAMGAGGEIAISSDFDGNVEIYVMNADGSGVRRLTNNPSPDWLGSWSPDGSRIAFFRSASYRSGYGPIYDIYVVNADGSGATRLTNDSLASSGPVWSPDGSKIAFHRYHEYGYSSQIYVMNADGSGVTRLTNNPGGEFGCAWSPDGSLIVFTSLRDDNLEIYVMNADGSNPVNLTNNPASDGFDAWSPDGSKMAFTSDRDGNREIYVMNPDGSGVIRLTNNLAWDRSVAWSPDGTRIAFIRYRDALDTEIHVMNADGSGATLLTNNLAYSVPAWRPQQGSLAQTPRQRMRTR
jgi:TolB protein